MSEVLVLRDEVTSSDVDAVATLERWKLREETARAHWVLASRRWATPSGDEITYVVDHPGASHSLRIEGSSAGETLRRLRMWLPFHTEDELLGVVLDPEVPDPVACIRLASKLAACRPPRMHPRHLDALRRLLAHPQTAVRRAGIRSAYGCEWPELRALVEERRADEQRLWVQLEELRRYLDGEASAGR